MRDSGTLLFLSLEDVLACGGADMAHAIEDLRVGFRLLSEGRVDLPHKTTLRASIDEHSAGIVNVMPARVDLGTTELYSCKAIGAMPSNVQEGLPRATGLILLFDPRTKTPQCVMDAQAISATRTGAVTALAARRLADPDAEEAGLVGAGVNMRTQLLGLKAALPGLRRAKVYSRGESKHSFARAMSLKTGLEIVPVDSCAEAVRDCPVVVTCLPNVPSPVVRADWVKDGGVTLFHIGAYEVEPALLTDMDRIVCDLWSHSKHRGLQTHARAAAAGFIDESRIEDLAPILNGEKPGRRTPWERIYFAPVGLGFEDGLVAWRVFQEARLRGAGLRLPLWKTAEWI